MAIWNSRRLAIWLALTAASTVLAAPAGAQFFHGAALLDQAPRAEPVQFREFFPFFGDRRPYYQPNPYPPQQQYNPFFQQRPPQAVEATKPPPPKKVETQPTSTVLVIGDGLADWLGYGLEEAFADTPDIGIARKIRPYSGLVRYEPRLDAPEWSQAVKDVLAAEKPAAIVVMLGLNDRLALRDRAPPAKSATASTQGQDAAKGAAPPAAAAASDSAPPDSEQPPAAAAEAPRRPQSGTALGQSYEFHTDKWAELYEKRIDDMIAALKSKGVPVLWVGLPAIRGTKSTTDMSYLDELYHARADKAGIVYVDIWDGFVDDQGRYAVQGPDFEGQIRRLRTFDGVNFTKAGAEKLAHYVERELRRVLTSRVTPVALPGPEEQSPAKGNARPAIGPVVPLNASAGGEGGELLGTAGHPAQHETDPLASRVLSRGDAIPAPAGRADDFSWPRAEANPGGAADATPEPTMPAPAVPAKGAAAKSDTSKTDPNKNEPGKGETKSGASKTGAAKSAAPAASTPR